MPLRGIDLPLVHTYLTVDMSDSTPAAQLLAMAADAVATQVDCSLRHAFTLIQERATITGRTTHEIAAAVVDRSIRFDI